MVRRYRIRSRAALPERMAGEFSYEAGYQLVCDWNFIRRVEHMAWLECVESGLRGYDAREG